MSIYQQLLNQAVKHHKIGNWAQAELIYNRLLSRSQFDETLLFLMGDMYIRREYNGLAVNLLTTLVAQNPNHAQAWCNLGIGYRKENFYDDALRCWNKALEVGGETIEVLSNMAGLYADNGRPFDAVGLCDRALALDPSNSAAKWQKALALLSLREWAGWELYESRKNLEGWDNRTVVDCPQWDFNPVDRLLIHGEQGIGDEVMFLSCVDEVLPLAKHVTLELNSKVSNIARLTWPTIPVIHEAAGEYDAKIAIGSLAARLRRDGKFPGKPYLKPDPKRVEFYKNELRKLGKGPYLALTWVGGTKQTRVEDRSFPIGLLRPFMEKYRCVSAQYVHTNEMIQPERETVGLLELTPESTGTDLAEQAALFLAVDAVVTCQQTAVHVAGAVGARTFAMIPSNPHWRYGINGYNMPWYQSVELIRKVDTWEEVTARTLRKVDAHFAAIRRTEQAAA